MADDATTPAPKNAGVIAKFFGMKAKEALEELKKLTDEDKQQLGEGIRNETFTY